ncbi:MAG: methyltransferase domain-containing protein [Chloroflexota bacterium]
MCKVASSSQQEYSTKRNGQINHLRAAEPNNQSVYVDYNESFTVYDQSRQPNGLPELLQLFSETSTPLHEQIILEGGFGTGAYIEQIRHYVKTAYGVEGSDEGYHQALHKLKGVTNVHLQVGNILDLAFTDEFFDGYMLNQVSHHLDTSSQFPNLNSFLKESYRVLKEGGVLIINTCSQEQMEPASGSFWHHTYVNKQAKMLQARYIPINELITRLESFGFSDIKQTIPSGRLFNNRLYDDPTIALKPDFKLGDSVYAGMSSEVTVVADTSMAAAIEDGSIYDEMKRAAQRAAEIGETIIVSARKL